MINTEALRKKVIDLAIQGKLTQQLPEDGNAEALFAQIQCEKTKLIKEGKIKKEKQLPEISADEIPFEIPDNWKWVRIGQIFTLQAGKNKTSSDIHSEVSSEYKYPCYGGNGLRGYVDEKNVSGKHILIGRQGALCGNINIADNEFWATEHAVVVYQYGNTAVDFYEHLLRALDLNQYATSVAQPGLAVSSIVKVLIPLPPLDEQKRIVEIIDEVISLIDIIEELQQQYEADCEILKGKIINAGIRGMLTDQLPEDGNAEDLYEQIQNDKALLIKEGKIKKEKTLPEISDDEIPFEIPNNWKWVRLGNYSQKITDQVASGSFASLRDNVPSLKEPSYAIMVKTADFANGFSKNLTYTDKNGYEFLSNSNLFGGELILSNIGSIGKCFIVPKLDIKMTLAPNSIMIRLTNEELRDYLYYFILSKQGYLELDGISTGTAVKKFNKTDLKKILIPVPPLDEQKRISSKVEEIFELLRT